MTSHALSSTQQNRADDYYTLLLREMSDLRESLKEKDETIYRLKEQISKNSGYQIRENFNVGARKNEELVRENEKLKQDLMKISQLAKEQDIEIVKYREKCDNQVSFGNNNNNFFRGILF